MRKWRGWAIWQAEEQGPKRPRTPVTPVLGTSLLVTARRRLAPWASSTRGRLLLVCAGAVLFALFAAPASQFQTEFLRQQRHYSAFGISVLQQTAGTIGALGVLVGGRLADTHGRRPVAVACVMGATAATLWSYLAHGWPLWLATTSGQFFLYATAPVLGVYGAELFATASRARSAGLWPPRRRQAASWAWWPWEHSAGISAILAPPWRLWRSALCCSCC